MGFDDSLDFITGNSTDNDKRKKRLDNELENYEDQWTDPGQKASAEDALRARVTDPNHPGYLGPGYEVRRNDAGILEGVLVNKTANDDWKVLKAAAAGAPPAGPSVNTEETIDDTFAEPAPRAPTNVRDVLGAQPKAPTSALRSGSFRAGQHGSASVNAYLDTIDPDTKGLEVSSSSTQPVEGMNRERLDPLFSGISEVQRKLLELAEETEGMSAAEAALHKASREADLRSAIATEASQRGALGAARGARNRGDRALLERQAVGEQSFIGQEAARTDALRTAEQEGNLAILRATEEENDKKFRAEVLDKAAGLGLNIAAAEIDISKANLTDASQRISQALGYAELDQRKAESILGFTKDMAMLQYEYDKLSVEDQNAADALLMQKYGIDQQTMVALKQIKEAGKFRWDQVLTAFVGGAATGGTSAIASTLLDDDKPKA